VQNSVKFRELETIIYVAPPIPSVNSRAVAAKSCGSSIPQTQVAVRQGPIYISARDMATKKTGTKCC
jgi:hypothetical protein